MGAPPRRTQPKPAVDRLPPHSQEAEAGLLSCCLQDPARCVPMCVGDLRGGGQEFYDLRHQEIYAAIVAMFDENRLPTVDLLCQTLRDRNMYEQVGGLPYLLQLQDAAPSPAQLPEYVDILRQKFSLREMVRACTDAVGRIYENGRPAEELIDEAERDVMAVRQLSGVVGRKTARDMVLAALTRIESIHERGSHIDGLPTGYPDYDHMTGGLHGDEMVVIAALPSKGKTSLAMNIAEHVAVDQGRPVGVWSLEMSGEILMTRAVCSRARVGLKGRRLNEGDFQRITSAAGQMAKARIWFEDPSDLTCYQFRAQARRARQEHNIELAVLDYLQLLTAPGRKFEGSREQEVSEIARVIKATTRELGIPVITMSQLNDQGELRESRAIGQHSDTVCKLQCDASDEDVEAGMDSIPYTLRITKQRNGPKGRVALTFMPAWTRFESAARVADADVPADNSYDR